MYVRDSLLGDIQDDQQLNGPILAAVSGILSAASTGAKLFGGKVHYSPWNFLYDEYPRKIYEAEVAIRTARGEALPPDPDPGNPTPKGGSAYQASMLNIVPRYVPGSEPLIVSYDRRLNEAGGAYERTYQAQLAALAQIQGQAAPAMPTQSASAARPVSQQPTYQPAPVATPPSQYPITDGYGNVVDPRTGRVVQRATQAGMLGDIPLPILIGGAVLLAIFAMTQGGSGNGHKRGR